MHDALEKHGISGAPFLLKGIFLGGGGGVISIEINMNALWNKIQMIFLHQM